MPGGHLRRMQLGTSLDLGAGLGPGLGLGLGCRRIWSEWYALRHWRPANGRSIETTLPLERTSLRMAGRSKPGKADQDSSKHANEKQSHAIPLPGDGAALLLRCHFALVSYLLRKSVKRSLSASSLLLRPSAAGVTILPLSGGRGEHEADVRGISGVHVILVLSRRAVATISNARFAMSSKSWISHVGALLIACVLTVALSISTLHAVEDAHKIGVVSFGLFGDQGVFRSEATGAAEIVASRFETGPIDVQYNSKKDGSATIEGLARSLQLAASRLDAEKDVLFLILTSHGSPDGLAIKAGRRTQTLTPSGLAEMLAKTRVRHKVVVISACYSGVFIPRLANPDVMVITAADADHPSFGCQDEANWTYFGDAFFNVTLRQADSLRDAFVTARALVRKRELREHFEPSNPLMAGGANVQPLLIPRP